MKLDLKQITLLEELTKIALEINKAKPLFAVFNKKSLKDGIYLYGPVGTGKTMVMNAFFDLITLSKTMVHYQNFMQEIHQFVHQNKYKLQEKSKNNILSKLAKNYAKHTKVLCIDEFEIKDITDAMIIGNLFTELLKQGVFIFITSNTIPGNLYKNGLQRESFLPFIDMINDKFYVKSLDNNHDYRFDKAINLKGEKIIYPLNVPNQNKFKQIIADISDNNFSPQNIEVLGRQITFQKIHKKILVTNYEELFVRELSYIDYVNICQQFNIIVVQNVHPILPDNTDIAVRFINFIDNAYFYKILLFMSLEVQPEKIYQGFARSEEFKRTISRLHEMNSDLYLLDSAKISH